MEWGSFRPVGHICSQDKWSLNVNETLNQENVLHACVYILTSLLFWRILVKLLPQPTDETWIKRKFMNSIVYLSNKILCKKNRSNIYAFMEYLRDPWLLTNMVWKI